MADAAIDEPGTDGGERRPTLTGPYRVELRDDDQAIVLARLSAAVAHHTELAPFAGRLQQEGQTAGELVLVDEHTGLTVARRDLCRPVRPVRRPERPIRPSSLRRARPATRRLHLGSAALATEA